MIPITKPCFDERENLAVSRVLESGWIVQGSKVAEFERRFEEFQQCNFAVAVTSATTALHLAMVIMMIGRGDEVIVPAFTHPATANVVRHVGAKPVFVDVTLPNFNIDCEGIESKITKRTKAIIPVHLFGFPSDMDSIIEIAKRFSLWVVEDAACAMGTTYKGRKVGTIGHCGAFSFHPRKSITTGEGGMLTADDKWVQENAKIFRSHGESVSDESRHNADEIVYPEFTEVGFNYRMTDIQAAIGVEQMKKAPYILQERLRVAGLYDELLSDLEKGEYLTIPPKEGHSYQSYVVLLGDRAMNRDELSNQLHKAGISTRKGTYNVPRLACYRDQEYFPNSEKAEARSLALPMYAGMEDKDIEYVAENLRKALA